MTPPIRLDDPTWQLIGPMIHRPRRTGRPRRDDRLMFEGILWIRQTGRAWRDLPASYGPWSTVYQRFRDWKSQGVLSQAFEVLAGQATPRAQTL